jgi:DNA-binding transcriptional MerR regulator
MKHLRVGELAKRSGLTVRTLHHYDQIGLLSPAERGPGGYRLYGEDEIARLTQILILRRLDLSLAEIREVLARPETSLRETIARQIEHFEGSIELQTRLVERLRALHSRLESHDRVSVDQLTQLMEMMTMFEKYYTPEQMEALKKRGEALGEGRIRQAEAEWPQLIARMQEELAKGTDPASATVQALARRWRELIEQFTGGDAGIESSLRDMYGQEPQMREQTGMDPSLMEFVARANAAALDES